MMGNTSAQVRATNEAVMRCTLAALGLIGLLSPAFAADYELPNLRGSQTFVPAFPTYFNWQGFYAGGQLTYSSASTNFSAAPQPLIAFSLRELALEAIATPDKWQVLGSRDTGAAGFGGFIGYNIQWDNAIIGLEFNYTHSSLNSVAPHSPLERVVGANGLIYDVVLDASGSVHISDFATTRTRLGWAIGNFMPYATLGFAFGRADLAVSSIVFGTQTDPGTQVPNPNPPPATIPQVVPFLFTQSQSKNGAYLYGYSGGAGLEFALTNNIFARGEYEYIQWQRFWVITSSMHNFRAGLGVKF
jgi:outer membrane immunogenic protein